MPQNLVVNAFAGRTRRAPPPPKPRVENAPNNALVEAVGRAFDDIARDFNVMKHITVGDRLDPTVGHYKNRRTYCREEPMLSLEINESRRENMPRRYMATPRTPGDWLQQSSYNRESTINTYRYPRLIPLQEERMISERRPRIPYTQMVNRFERNPVIRTNETIKNVMVDYATMHDRRLARNTWAPQFPVDPYYTNRAVLVVV